MCYSKHIGVSSGAAGTRTCGARATQRRRGTRRRSTRPSWPTGTTSRRGVPSGGLQLRLRLRCTVRACSPTGSERARAGSRKMSLVQLHRRDGGRGNGGTGAPTRCWPGAPGSSAGRRPQAPPRCLRACGRGCAPSAATGSHRDRNGVYEHAEAISILDRWWSRWMRVQFRADARGGPAQQLLSLIQQDDDPNLDGEHHGSAYQNGWYGYARKDLRRLLGQGSAGRTHGSTAAARRAARAPSSLPRPAALRAQAGGGGRPGGLLQGREL